MNNVIKRASDTETKDKTMDTLTVEYPLIRKASFESLGSISSSPSMKESIPCDPSPKLMPTDADIDLKDQTITGEFANYNIKPNGSDCGVYLTFSPAEPDTIAVHASDGTESEVNYLPAYPAASITEIMQNHTRSTWRDNTKYANHHHRSEVSPIRPNLGPGQYHQPQDFSRPQTQYAQPRYDYSPQRGRQSMQLQQQRSYPVLQRDYNQQLEVYNAVPQGHLQQRPCSTHKPPPSNYRRPSEFQVNVGASPNYRPYEETYNTASMPMHSNSLQDYQSIPINHIEESMSPNRRPYSSQYNRLTQIPSSVERNYNLENMPTNHYRSTPYKSLSAAAFNGRAPQPVNHHGLPHNHTRTSVPSGEYQASSSTFSSMHFAKLITQAHLVSTAPPNTDNYEGYGQSNDSYHSHSYRSSENGQGTPEYQSYGSLENSKNGYSSAGHNEMVCHHSPVSGQSSYGSVNGSPYQTAYQARPVTSKGPESDIGRRSPSASRDTMSNSDYSGESIGNLPTDGSYRTYPGQGQMPRKPSYEQATQRRDYALPSEPTQQQTSKPNNLQRIKHFFTERTPPGKENQDRTTPNAKSLPSNLDVTKVGILAVKAIMLEGKKSTDRSWKAMGAALCRYLLYLFKDKKENATALTAPNMAFAADEAPIDITLCHVDIAYGYTKRDHVFRLSTRAGSEYMLQAESHAEMMAWMTAILANSNVNSSEKLTNVELVKRIHDQQSKLQSQQKRRLGNLPFMSKISSPLNRADNNSRKEKKSGKPEFGRTEVIGDFGRPLSECTPSQESDYIPLVVELCTKAIESGGMQVVGIYRVPGNRGAITQLINELNQEVLTFENERWRDMNVLSSLLKQYFRSLPHSLITSDRYKEFMEINEVTDHNERLTALKKLLRMLPKHNFETLKYLIKHLRKVAEFAESHKMDTRNLAIVFGPTICHQTVARSSKDKNATMNMVNDMPAQYKVTETLILYGEWLFNDDNSPPPNIDESQSASATDPITETMNNMSIDLAKLTGKKSNKSQLLDALSASTNKNTSKLNPSKSLSSSQPINKLDDCGFKNRDIVMEAAARSRRLIEHQNQTTDHHSSLNRSYNSSLGYSDTDNGQERTNPRNSHTQHYNSPHHSSLHKWRSEESVLLANDKSHSGAFSEGRPNKLFSQSVYNLEPAPPLPARHKQLGPPLPPKPSTLYRAVVTQIGSPENSFSSGFATNDYTAYENYNQFSHQPPVHTIQANHPYQPYSAQNRGPQLRRGSLDSVMDKYEPPRYSDSEDSEDEQPDRLSSMKAPRDVAVQAKQPKHSSDSSAYSSLNHPIGNNAFSPAPNRRLSNEKFTKERTTYENGSSSDHGFDGSTSSINSTTHKNIGIASRIERNDMRPVEYVAPFNAILRERKQLTGDVTSEEERDWHSNHISRFIHRKMSEEKKKMRRRHTVGGAQDFDALKDMLAGNERAQAVEEQMNAVNRTDEDERQLSAWERLQLTDSSRPNSIHSWLEKERGRTGAGIVC